LSQILVTLEEGRLTALVPDPSDIRGGKATALVPDPSDIRGGKATTLVPDPSDISIQVLIPDLVHFCISCL
jgi:hypothetical protein